MHYDFLIKKTMRKSIIGSKVTKILFYNKKMNIKTFKTNINFIINKNEERKII